MNEHPHPADAANQKDIDDEMRRLEADRTADLKAIRRKMEGDLDEVKRIMREAAELDASRGPKETDAYADQPWDEKRDAQHLCAYFEDGHIIISPWPRQRGGRSGEIWVVNNDQIEGLIADLRRAVREAGQEGWR